MRWRVSITICLGTGWLVFIPLYAAFWSGGFTLFQNLVIVFVSFVVLAGCLGALWAAWGMRFADRWDKWRSRNLHFGDRSRGAGSTRTHLHDRTRRGCTVSSYRACSSRGKRVSRREGFRSRHKRRPDAYRT